MTEEKSQELLMEFDSPVVNMAYQNIENISLDEYVYVVEALIMSGNQIKKFDFVTCFANLSMLHLDSCGLAQLALLRPLLQLQNLEFLVLRNNNLTRLDDCPSFKALKHLDISFNPVEPGSLPQLLQLDRLFFGYPSEEKFKNSRLQFSRSKINVMKLLTTSIIGNTSIIYSTENRAVINDLSIRIEDNFHLKILKTCSDAQIKNWKCALSYYSIITGVEIVKVASHSYLLQELIARKKSVIDGIKFDIPPVNYPSAHPNDSQLSVQLNQLRHQQLTYGVNYFAVVFHIFEQSAIFLFERNSNAFVGIETESDKIQDFIASTVNQQVAAITEIVEDQKLNYQINSFSQSLVVTNHLRSGHHAATLLNQQTYAKVLNFKGRFAVGEKIGVQPIENVEKVYYFQTFKSKQLLLKQLRYLLKSQKIDTESVDLDELLFRSILLFNQSETEIDKDEVYFTYLTFQINNILIPMQIELVKLVTIQPREKLILNASMREKYIIARVCYNQQKAKLIISEIPTFLKPCISCVELIDNTEKNGSLQTIVYERFIENGEEIEQEIESEAFIYSYFRNNQFIIQSKSNTFSPQFFGVEAAGTFYVTLEIRDYSDNVIDEVESAEITISVRKLTGVQKYAQMESESDESSESAADDYYMKPAHIAPDPEEAVKAVSLYEQQTSQPDQSDQASLSKQAAPPPLTVLAPSQPAAPVPVVAPVQKLSSIPTQQEGEFVGAFPIMHEVLKYSQEVGMEGEILLWSPYSKSKPVVTLVMQMNVEAINQSGIFTQFTGFQPTKYDSNDDETGILLVQMDGKYLAKYVFSERDTGKIAWFYVSYEQKIQHLIPITRGPIKGQPLNGLIKEQVTLIDIGRRLYLKSSLVEDQDRLVLKDLNEKELFTASFFDVVPVDLTPEFMNSCPISLQNSDRNLLFRSLKCGQRLTFSFDSLDVFTSAATEKIADEDDDQLCNIEDAPDISICVLVRGRPILLQCEDPQSLTRLQLYLQKKCGLLFPENHVDQQLSQFVDAKYVGEPGAKNVQDYFTYMQLLSISLDPKVYAVGETLEVCFQHPHVQFQTLLQHTACLAITSKDNIQSLKVNESNMISLTLNDMHAGFLPLLLLNGKQYKLSGQGISSQLFESTKSIQTVHVSYVLEGKLTSAELIVDQSKVFLSDYLQCQPVFSGLTFWKRSVGSLGLGFTSVELSDCSDLPLLSIALTLASKEVVIV